MTVRPAFAAGAALFACVAPCAAEDGGRLVRRMDFDVPESWTPPQIMGLDYRPMLAPGMWACPGKYNDERAKRLGQGLLPRPDWPLFRDCALDVAGQRGTVPRIAARMTRPETWRERMADRRLPPGSPFHVSEFFTDNLLTQFIDNPKRGAPLFATLTDARPAFFLEERYNEDAEGFRRWKADNPNFFGFIVLGELESDLHWYCAGIGKCTNEAVRARMLRDFPPPRNPLELAEFVKKAWARTRGIHFGEDRLWALSSGTYSFSHLHAANGAKGLFSECSGSQGLARWQLSTAFLRGAARQHGIPFGHYFAHFYSGLDRNTGKIVFGENKWSRYPWSNEVPKRDGFHYPYKGVSRSLTDRANAYAWLAGTSFAMPENDAGLYFVLGEDGNYRPSDYARDLDGLYRLSRRVRRGAAYTPVALVVSGTERYGHSDAGMCEDGGYWNDDVFSMDAFLLTLLPVRTKDPVAMRKEGLEGCLFNSPFGEMYDVVAGDLGQDGERMFRALAGYKAAFLVGGLRKDGIPLDALERYVRNGGTLVVSCDRVTDGFVSTALAGVEFSGETVASGKSFEDGESLEGEYRWHSGASRGARPLWKDDRGTVAAWTHDVGKGRVVTVASRRMLPAEYDGFRETLLDVSPASIARYRKVRNGMLSGDRRFSLVRRLLASAQAETMPVSVEGDVQWGVNRTSDGWLVWLVNNRGTRHFSCEPETFDPSCAANVTVAVKAMKEAIASDLRTGEEIAVGGCFTASVPPGGWRIFGVAEKR